MVRTTRDDREVGCNAADDYTSKDGHWACDQHDDGDLIDDGTYTCGYDFADRLVKVTRNSAVIRQCT